MANIDVEPKKGRKSSWLTWLLLASALVILFFILSRNNKKEPGPNDVPASTSAGKTASGQCLPAQSTVIYA